MSQEMINPPNMASEPANARLHQIDLVQSLSQDIARAINSTNEEVSSQFLPGRERDRILTPERLSALYSEIFLCLGSGFSERHDHSWNEYAVKTSRNPSRLSLLALLLYDQREESLEAFARWLLTDGDFPCDDDLPFSSDSERLSMLPQRDHEYILHTQPIFKTLIIKESRDQSLPSGWRKPIIGEPQHLKSGSGGSVFKVKIAPGHWQYKWGGGLTTNEQEIEVVIKVFGPESHKTAESAREDFKAEKGFLNQLRGGKTINASILKDWGSITEKSSLGTIHSIFYEWANCDLQSFLEDDGYSLDYARHSIILLKATEILEAVEFLHNKFHYLHLDIKPDNILVFLGEQTIDDPGQEGSQARRVRPMDWRITDFNLSQKKTRKEASKSDRSSSYISRVPSPRKAGLYQAPEIEERTESFASDKSDVWSMGCVLLMVLAFFFDGKREFQDLYRQTEVEFKINGDRAHLFYLSESSTNQEDSTQQWPGPQPPTVRYLGNYRPRIHTIDQGLKATVHTGALEWSANILEKASGPMKECLRKFFKLIFMEVLVPDRKQRIDAAAFHRRFRRIQRNYTKIERPEDAKEFSVDAKTPGNILHESSPTHSKICDAVIAMDASNVTVLLKTNHENPNIPCSLCNKYPIERILDCQPSQARNSVLQALLELKEPEAVTTRITMLGSRPDALDMAWQHSGDNEALGILFRYRAEQILADEKFEENYAIARVKLGATCTKTIDGYVKTWKKSQEGKPKRTKKWKFWVRVVED